MPTVGLELARSAVIAGDDQNVGFKLRDAGNGAVELLDPLDLGGKIPILAGRIGVFEVYEEEIEIVPGRFEPPALVIERLSRFENLHADQTRKSPVHGIDGDRGRAQAKN